MFWKKSPGNNRDDVEDVILLFTDGRPEVDGPAPKAEAEIQKANYYSDKLKEKNVKIVGVAAGQPDQIASFIGNIKQWATHPSLVIKTGLKALEIEKNVKTLVESLVIPLCKPALPTPGTHRLFNVAIWSKKSCDVATKYQHPGLAANIPEKLNSSQLAYR